MFEQFFGEFLDPILQDTSLSPRSRLEKLFDIAYDKMESGACQTGCPFVNLATETGDVVPTFRKMMNRFFSKYRKKLADCYQEGVQKGEFRSDITPSTAALTILAGINGIAVLTKVQKNPLLIRELGQTTLFLLGKSRVS